MTAGEAKAIVVASLAVVRFGVQLASSTLLGVANALRMAELELIGAKVAAVASADDVARQWAEQRMAEAPTGGIDDYGPMDGPPH